MAFGFMKLTAAIFICACAGYVLSQAIERSMNVTPSEEDDPILRKDDNTGSVFRLFRNQKDSFYDNDATYAPITICWLKDRIKKAFNDGTVKKVAFMRMSKLISECPDEALVNLYENGVTDVLIAVDYRGEIKHIEFIKNTAEPDSEVIRLLGDEEMIVVIS